MKLIKLIETAYEGWSILEKSFTKGNEQLYVKIIEKLILKEFGNAYIKNWDNDVIA